MHVVKSLIYTIALCACSIAAFQGDSITLMHRDGKISNSIRKQSLLVLPPSKDPWYTAPDGFESTAPGTILRVRPAPGNLKSIIANCSAIYNILYRTTDTRYRPSWAVTSLIVPKSLPSGSNKADILLSYQDYYDSADVDYSPSYALYGGASPFVQFALAQGWYVNTPDYEGPMASFTAGVQSGHATLDSIRAVLNSNLGLTSDAKYAMMGYSGGEIASEWAAELQVSYAPELNFTGMAIGDLTPNVTSIVYTASGTSHAGIIFEGIVGIFNQHPEAFQFLNSSLRQSGPYNATTFFSVTSQSPSKSFATFAHQNLSDYFPRGYEGLLANPATMKVINSDGIQGYHGVPQMPIYITKAIHDELSPIADSDKLVDRYCEDGANIVYRRNTVGGHGSTSPTQTALTFKFLAEVFAGTYNHTGCTIETVTLPTS